MKIDGLPHRFLFPIVGLTIPFEWSVGGVTLYPPGQASRLIESVRATEGKVGRTEPIDELIDKAFGAPLDKSTVVEVTALDEVVAYEHAADVLGVLRLFAAHRHPMVNTEQQTFGLPSEVVPWRVDYLDLDTGPGLGFFRGGPAPFWTFLDEDLAAFDDHEGFQWLANAYARTGHDGDVLPDRMMLGTRLLSTAILDFDSSDRKLLTIATALEVMLGEPQWHNKGLGIARRASFLSCSMPGQTMCGRDRPSCHYLSLDPNPKRPPALNDLLAWADEGPGGQCSSYLAIRDLYRHRNNAVHDGRSGLSMSEVRSEAWKLMNWLVPPLLTWCSEHDGDDLSALDQEIEQVVLKRPPTWDVPQSSTQRAVWGDSSSE